MSGAAKLRAKINPDGSLIAIIGDDDTITGFLLAGVGNVNRKRERNFLVVDDSKTPTGMIEEAFRRFVGDKNIAMILITQNAASKIRHVLSEQTDAIPAILEIPSKDVPYDPSKDFIMQRIQKMFSLE
eukprot:c52147_g1_i1.p2 GENE.c52147_g1_i1~~c52147_g1_i1.p2  ORF type:complete len:128 (+),score=38.71 c52147_g1_i1:41-424(+)